MEFLSILQISSDDEVWLFYRRIAENVRQIRTQKGVSQLELALLIGQNSAAFISKAETGSMGKHFNLEQLYKIAKALDIDIKTLFDFDRD